jgi:hypothetical protein
MHDFLRDFTEKAPNGLNFSDDNHGKELFLGDVFQAAIYNDMRLQSVIFQNEPYYDVGTSDDLIRALKRNIF